MAITTDLDSFPKFSYYSNSETRSLYFLELMKSIFGPVPINPFKIEPSIVNENWPSFKIISDGNFTVNSLLILCILSSVIVRPTSVSKLFCDHSNLTWEYVKNIP